MVLRSRLLRAYWLNSGPSWGATGTATRTGRADVIDQPTQRFWTPRGFSDSSRQPWSEVTASASEDSAIRASVITSLHVAARQYKEHPPIEVINELLRQCSTGSEMENVHKLTEIIGVSGVQPDSETYTALAANYTYFPRPGSDAPG